MLVSCSSTIKRNLRRAARFMACYEKIKSHANVSTRARTRPPTSATLSKKSIGVRSEFFSDDDGRDLLSSDSIGELQFQTDRPTKRLNTNSTVNFGDFIQLQLKSIGVWSETLPTTVGTFYHRIQSKNSDF